MFSTVEISQSKSLRSQRPGGVSHMQIAQEFPAVAPLAAHLERNIVVVDAGCRSGVADVWSAFGRHVTVIGFDPDDAECRRLTEFYGGRLDVRFVATALGPWQGKAVLYLTRRPECNSLCPSDLTAIRHRHNMHYYFTPVSTTTVELTTLDDWAAAEGVDAIDFIKLDTQGSELGILEGAERCLKAVRVLKTEVSFNEMYCGQCLFGDVDRFLRDRGFVLWRFSNLTHFGMTQAKWDFIIKDKVQFDARWLNIASRGGQIFWGEAYYVRKEIAFGEETADWQGCLRDACLVSALGYRDLAGWTLRRALAYAPDAVAAEVRQILCD